MNGLRQRLRNEMIMNVEKRFMLMRMTCMVISTVYTL